MLSPFCVSNVPLFQNLMDIVCSGDSPIDQCRTVDYIMSLAMNLSHRSTHKYLQCPAVSSVHDGFSIKSVPVQ